jgi:hypothetical protein
MPTKLLLSWACRSQVVTFLVGLGLNRLTEVERVDHETRADVEPDMMDVLFATEEHQITREQRLAGGDVRTSAVLTVGGAGQR